MKTAIQKKFNSNRHCVYLIYAHLVFVTKYRRKIFNKHMLIYMEDIFVDICQSLNATLVEFDGEQDHVHLLVSYPPKLAVSTLVNLLKGKSSRLIRKNFPSIKTTLWKGGLWSPSYFVCSCGGAPISVIKQYIQQQKTPTD